MAEQGNIEHPESDVRTRFFPSRLRGEAGVRDSPEQFMSTYLLRERVWGARLGTM